jgi:hypothetical protein
MLTMYVYTISNGTSGKYGRKGSQGRLDILFSRITMMYP